MKKFVLALIVLVGGAAAYTSMNQQEPAEFYLQYHELTAQGRSFEDDAAYYAASRRAEVQAQLDARGNGAEGLKTAYLDMTSNHARCSDLALSEETRSGDVVRLVFDVTDTCNTYEEGVTVREVIELIDENGGWKILSNETNVSGG